MTGLLQEKIQQIKALFKLGEGHDSYVSLESDFYAHLSLHDLFAPLEDEDQPALFVSDVVSIDFFSMYTAFEGTRSILSADNVGHEIKMALQNTWSFNKRYHASGIEQLPHTEEQVHLKIAEIAEILKSLNAAFLSAEVFHFDARGYDYSLIAIAFSTGVQVIEFLWYID